MNKQLTQQNLRELARLTFLNLMSVNGVMAKTIIRNYKERQERENNVHRQIQKYANTQKRKLAYTRTHLYHIHESAEALLASERVEDISGHSLVCSWIWISDS